MQQFLQADSSGCRSPLPSSSSAQTSSLLPSQAGPPPGGDLPQTGPFFLCNILLQKSQASSNVERILEHLPPRTFPIFASSSLANLSKASSPAVWTKKGLLCSEVTQWPAGKGVVDEGEGSWGFWRTCWGKALWKGGEEPVRVSSRKARKVSFWSLWTEISTLGHSSG